jgi:hypothetical protein
MVQIWVIYGMVVFLCLKNRERKDEKTTSYNEHPCMHAQTHNHNHFFFSPCGEYYNLRFQITYTLSLASKPRVRRNGSMVEIGLYQKPRKDRYKFLF